MRASDSLVGTYILAILGLLDAIALRDDAEDGLFARLLQLAGDDELVKDCVCLLEVEDAGQVARTDRAHTRCQSSGQGSRHSGGSPRA